MERTADTQITEAVDAERRRIERDLHDGTQQFLTSAMMILQQARAQLANVEQNQAADLLALAMDRLLDTSQELRRVTRTIYPALLEQVGLLRSLESLVDRSALRIELTWEPLPPLPEGVELTAYFVVSEALANVAKHARTDRAHVRVGVGDDGALELAITDEGTGTLDSSRGTGLRGLATRVQAEGGELTLSGRRGQGSTVAARWPVGSQLSEATGEETTLGIGGSQSEGICEGGSRLIGASQPA